MDPDQLRALVARLLQGSATDEERAALRETLIVGDVTVEQGDFVARDKIVQLAPGDLDVLWQRLYPAAVHTLRAPVANFTGRAQDVDELVRQLSGEGDAGHVTALRGMGGIGKTELALVVAQRLRPRYPDAQLLIELQVGERPLEPADVLASLLLLLAPGAKLPETLAERQARLRSAMHGRRGLLLLDNAASAAQIAPLLPPPPGWTVLVTSRERFYLPGAGTLEVPLLAPEEALALLQRLLLDGRRGELAGQTESLENLADLCGYLPLALTVAGGFLTNDGRNWSLDRYRQALEAQPLKRLVTGDQRVDRVLGLSIAQLAAEQTLRVSHPKGALKETLSVSLSDRWHLLALCPAPFDERAAAALWGAPAGVASLDEIET
ncbi:MAG: NB-ARC domain-containing protein, partial [Ardenticatenaceae bacterium]